jgi:hypothetical protein
MDVTGSQPVFYTNMGHREDVWTNPVFKNVLFGEVWIASGQSNMDLHCLLPFSGLPGILTPPPWRDFLAQDFFLKRAPT